LCQMCYRMQHVSKVLSYAVSSRMQCPGSLVAQQPWHGCSCATRLQQGKQGKQGKQATQANAEACTCVAQQEYSKPSWCACFLVCMLLGLLYTGFANPEACTPTQQVYSRKKHVPAHVYSQDLVSLRVHDELHEGLFLSLCQRVFHAAERCLVDVHVAVLLPMRAHTQTHTQRSSSEDVSTTATATPTCTHVYPCHKHLSTNTLAQTP
jgi:hypothetical protein